MAKRGRPRMSNPSKNVLYMREYTKRKKEKEESEAPLWDGEINFKLTDRWGTWWKARF